MSTPTVARYAVTFGLAGLYMPDSHSGCHEFNTRRELAEFIRGELEMYDLPKSLFRDAHVHRLWRFIKRHARLLRGRALVMAQPCSSF